ncbi:hypothetical protein AB0L40_05570 [Patulibacter sp. NPDC049589]|uniref:hypothetical protein n=1 Tax=Patulibacter sp. NPDC049589 TaxID=3154731 RepID=UPI003447AC16
MSRPDDPFDRLRAELRTAAEHRAGERAPAAAPAASARQAGRLGRVSRRSGLIAVVTTAVVASAAAAAVVATGGSPSAPSAGPLTRATPETTRTGGPADPGPPSRYAIHISPDLRVGQTGWCTSLTVRAASRDRSFGGAGCGPAATTSQPFIAGGYTSVPGGRLTYAIVDDTISVLRLRSGRRVVPRPGGGIPDGWRVIVLLPGENDRHAAYLRADGSLVDTGIGPGRFARGQRSGTTDGPPPDGSACRVVAPPTATVLRSRAIRGAPVPEPGVNGRAFLPCASALVRTPGGDVTATVLLDAARPGSPPAGLPGATAVPGHPGVVGTDPSIIGEARIVARRVGNAWLVVQSGDASELFARPKRRATDLEGTLEDLGATAP